MILDCFTFRNEFEMLELRIRTLWDSVDYFVLVEADKTHAGKQKPLFFDQRSEEFDQYRDKIIHIKVTDMPEGEDPWIRENFQRNCINRGLTCCKNDDIIMVSDADEIPRPETIEKTLVSNEISRVLEQYPIAFAQRNYYYFLNCLDESGLWAGTVMSKYKNMKSPQYLRDVRERVPRVRFGGWHFGYLGGAQRIIEKINACAHQEGNIPENNSLDRVQSIVLAGRPDIQHNPQDYRFVCLDDSYPSPIHELIKKYPILLKKDEGEVPGIAAYPQEGEKEIYQVWRWKWYLLKQKLRKG